MRAVIVGAFTHCSRTSDAPLPPPLAQISLTLMTAARLRPISSDRAKISGSVMSGKSPLAAAWGQGHVCVIYYNCVCVCVCVCE